MDASFVYSIMFMQRCLIYIHAVVKTLKLLEIFGSPVS